MDKHVSDSTVDVLDEQGGKEKEPYDMNQPSSYYKKVHFDTASDIVTFRVMNKVNTFARTTQHRLLQGMVNESVVFLAKVVDAVKVNYDKQPKTRRRASRTS